MSRLLYTAVVVSALGIGPSALAQDDSQCVAAAAEKMPVVPGLSAKGATSTVLSSAETGRRLAGFLTNIETLAAHLDRAFYPLDAKTDDLIRRAYRSGRETEAQAALAEYMGAKVRRAFEVTIQAEVLGRKTEYVFVCATSVTGTMLTLRYR